MTSATDELLVTGYPNSLRPELHKALKARGIDYWLAQGITFWNRDDGCECLAYGYKVNGVPKLAIKVVGFTDPEQAIAATLGPKVTGNTSDGYHTFNELYRHRAVLFSVIVRDHRELAWKSMRHHDGTMYDGMFIVGIETPDGQATYHYDIDPYWDMFNCKELDQAPEWDGHTPSEAIERIATLGSCNCSDICTNGERTETCHVESSIIDTYEYNRWEYELSCGHTIIWEDSEPPNYCPICGRRIEQ